MESAEYGPSESKALGNCGRYLMNSLSPTDEAQVQTAQECLKTSNPEGAKEALGKLSQDGAKHPSALEVSWELDAQAGNWESGLNTAKLLCELSPDNAQGWLYQACCLSELQRHAEAIEMLAAVVDRFPKIPMIAYNLACCACKLERLEEAEKWLHRAVAEGHRLEIKLMALDDPDMVPLLDQVCDL